MASRIAFGIGAIFVAVLIRLPLEPILGGRNTFLILEPAIAVAAWYGGFVSGGAATTTAIIAGVALYLSPAGSLAIASRGDFLSLILFSVNGVLFTFLSSGLRSAYQRATRARVTAEESAIRNYRLQRISLALNRPMSTAVLAQEAIGEAVELLGANGGLVAVGRPGDRNLRVMAVHGYTGDVASGTEVPNDSGTPLGDVIRSGEPTILRNRRERRERYPSVADKFETEGDSIVLPLLYQDVSTGAIYLNFPASTNYGPDDRDFLRSIGAQCGSALARSILIEQTDAIAAKEHARAAELGTVLEAIGDGLLVGDSDGRVTLANPAAGRLLGRVPTRLSDLPAHPDEVDAADEGPGDRYLVRSPIRSRGWLEVAHFPVTADPGSSDVVLIRDVTAAVEADLQRDAFLGVLSHELRTPITTIMVGVDLLRQADEIRSSEFCLDLLADIDADSTRLNRIVEDLLVLTRSERGALDASGEPVLVHRLVKGVVEREQHAWPGADIRLSVKDDLAPVEAEPTYVAQIVRNLLSNALKYGRAPGKPIEVVVSQREHLVEIRVLDRGVGIAPGEAERLFTLFYRNPKVVSTAPGAGIGLYVCRLLAEAMNGTAWARSRPGGGAEFGFSLPLMDASGARHAGANGRSHAVGSGATDL